ncbi:MAG: transposase [cyanobacterium endosymbiont of Rhopalodia yunnanensis]
MPFKLTPGNKDDHKLVFELRPGLMEKLFGNPRYIAQEFFEDSTNEDEAKVSETELIELYFVSVMLLKQLRIQNS